MGKTIERSNTQKGILYYLEFFVRSIPIFYLIARKIVRFTHIFEEDANGVEYQGFRAALAQDLSDEWTANLVLAHQTIDADGVFFADPTLGDLEIQTYTANEISDEYDWAENRKYSKIGEKSYIIDARIEIEIIREQLMVPIPEGDYETLLKMDYECRKKPDAFYEVFLKLQNDPDRIKNIIEFIDMFPKNENYSAPFLLELVKSFNSKGDSTKATFYALLLIEHVDMYPKHKKYFNSSVKPIIIRHN